MFVSRISSSPNRKNQPIHFGQSEFTPSMTDYRTDFDKTYMYYSQDYICKPNVAINKEEFNSIYRPFGDFFRSTKNVFETILTTGRNSPKFVEFLNNLKKKGAEIPLGKTVIVNNGGDIYHIGNPEEFFKSEQGLDISADNLLSIKKREEIKQLTNWDGDIIKSQFTKTLNCFGLDVFDSPINEFSDTYSDTILQQLNNRSYNHQSSQFASVQNDGKLGYHIALCKDLSYNQERLNQIKNSISESIGDSVKFDIKVTPFDPECGNGPSIRILPKIENVPLDKLYDTKLAVKNTLQNKTNKLIIASGDNLNDLRMLNPFSYLDLIDKDLGIIGNKIVKHEEDVYESSTKLLSDSDNQSLKNSLEQATEARNELIKEAKNYIEKNPELKTKIEELPFISISVKQQGAILPVSNEVREFFAFCQKTLLAEPDKLLDSVKNAMKIYASQNNKYRNGLTPEIKELLGIGKKILTMV